MPTPPPLPVDEVDGQLRGWKFAEVRGVDSPRVYPSGKYWRRGYEHRHTATAECHRASHVAPAVDCTCGFHAVPELDELTDVTEHHPRSVVLEVELGGTVVEHERGMRGEQQTVLAVLFPCRCDRCRRPATHVRRAKVWHSVCSRCAERAPHQVLSRADATALLGVDVGFTPVTTPVAPNRVMHAVRSLTVTALMTVCAVLASRVTPPLWIMAALVAGVLITACLAGGVLRSRLPRTRERLFLAQCLCLTLGSLLVIAATP